MLLKVVNKEYVICFFVVFISNFYIVFIIDDKDCNIIVENL